MTSKFAVGPSGLTEGALLEMLNDEIRVKRPVLQIVDLFTVSDSQHSRHERWQFMFNDGRHTFSRVMLSSEKELSPYSIITTEEYDCLTHESQTANGHITMKCLIITKASIKVSGHQLRKLNGDPKPLEDEVDGQNSGLGFKVEFSNSVLSNPRKLRQANAKMLVEPAETTVVSMKREVPRNGIIEYGTAKYEQNLEKARKIPGVVDCHYDWDLGLLIIKGEPLAIVTVKDNVELEMVAVKVPVRHLDHFRKAVTLKDLSKISRCSVIFFEPYQGLVLRGLQSEVNAALLLIEEKREEWQRIEAEKLKKKKNKSKNSANVNEPADASSSKADSKANVIACVPGTSSRRESYEPQIETSVVQNTNGASKMKVAEASEVDSSVSRLNNFFEELNIADCVVCLTERPTVAFVPCGHRHTCPACAKKIFEGDSRCCPTCREEIERCIRIWT